MAEPTKITIGETLVVIQDPSKGTEMEIFDGDERLAIIRVIDLLFAGGVEVIRLPPGQG